MLQIVTLHGALTFGRKNQKNA